MTPKIRRSINNLADEIRAIYDIPVPIEDIEEVVNKMNGIIEYSPSLLFDGRISKCTDGYHDFIISLPMSTSETRDLFTISHELGHLFLHMGYQIDRNKWETTDPNTIYNRDNQASEREYQANEFAAAFLMPKGVYGKVLKDIAVEGKVPIAKLAEHFNVSIDAAINRGKWLGYFAW